MNRVLRKFAGAARRLDPRPSESRPLSPSIRGDAVAAPPAFHKHSHLGWPQEDCAPVPTGIFARGQRDARGALGARVALVLLWLTASSLAAVREVGAIGLTVGDLDREIDFYTRVLRFEKVSESTSASGAADGLLGLSDTQLRSAELKIGHERITLTEHLTNKGRSIPPDSRSFDHWFQHIAIVVSDMDQAYHHLRQLKVKHVSTGPQTLPAWNQDAGGIKAFYFRDPEDHVLEIIWFPDGKGDPKWKQPTTNLFLGIDHTAIVVADTDKSLAFYRDALGMKVAGGAENFGTEQEHLNQVFGARLRITGLRAERGPGIEFLEYIAPPGGRPLPKGAQASDLVFWHPRLVVDKLANLAVKLRERQTRFVSKDVIALSSDASKPAREVIVRDPDGHALQLIEADKVLAEK
jgi:catechol 2,3-dioxygenase-like lactoylglutathione lyase family enzyme